MAGSRLSRSFTDSDGDPDATFADVIAEAESILWDPAASHHDLERAKDLADVINAHET